jgi:hypothetical protein
MEPGNLAILFKFHPDFSYALVDSAPGFAIGKPLRYFPVSTSAPYRTCSSPRNVFQ